MQLTTIADLAQPTADRGLLISRAMQLGALYDELKHTDNESYQYKVSIGTGRERKPGVHASEMSNCQRLLVYSIMGTERQDAAAATADANMQMRFDIGNAVHAMVQNDFHRMCGRLGGAVTFEEEVRVCPELGGAAAQWNMHSSCDGVFTFWHQGEAYLRVGLEIKTKSAPMFDKLVKPDDDHSEQTCLYMKALDLPLMWLFYYNKSNSNWTKPEAPYLYQFDQHLWDTKLEPRFAQAHEWAAAAHLPPREEGQQCRWCAFAWTCQPSKLKTRSYGPSSTAHRPGALRVVK